MKRKHISTEIFIYVSVGFLFVLTLILGLFLSYQEKVVQEKVNASIMGILNQTSNTLSEKINRTEALVSTLRLNSTLLEVLESEPDYKETLKIDALISDMSNSKIWSEEYITILGRNGHIFVNWENDGRIRYNQAILDLKQRLDVKDDILETVFFEKFVNYDNPDQYDKNKKLMGVVSFIYDYAYAHDPVGIITVGIPENSMVEIMEQNKLFEESEVYMIDKTGTVLLSTADERERQSLDVADIILQDSPEMSGFCRLEQDGKQMVAFYQKLDSDWTQVIMIPHTVYHSEMKMMVYTLAGSAVLVLALSLLISFLVSYSISKPIKELEQSIDQITKGNLKDRVNVVRSDDIGKLGIHFNAMADNLENLIEEKIKTQKRISELVIANKTAELKMLHAQINPHFLFNTLNSIRCLAIINKADYIAHTLEALGALLENSIMKGPENISIENEIKLLKKYIELQQMRYGKRLKAEFLVNEELNGYAIPKFMLQPLLENAITHGIMDKLEGGTIWVRGELQENLIRLEVEDDGVGLDAENRKQQGDSEKKTSGHGIAVSNIRDRLRQIYGESGSLELKTGRDGCGTIAVLILPAIRYKEEIHA